MNEDDPWASFAPLEPDGDIKPIITSLSTANPEIVDQYLVDVRNQLKQRLPVNPDNAANYRFLVHAYLQCLLLPNATYNAQHLYQLLPLLNPGYDKVYKQCLSIVTMVVIKFLKQVGENAEAVIKDYLEVLADDDEMDRGQYLNFVAVMTVCFPLIPQVVTPIYTQKSVKTIETQLSKATHDTLVITSTLELFSSSCITDECRNFNLQYLNVLVQGLDNGNSNVRLLSAVCIVKLWNFIKAGDKKVSVEKLANELLNNLSREEAIEGLAYLSLNPKVKELVRRNDDALETILGSVKHNAYGAVVILANLTTLGENNTQQKFQQAVTPNAPPEDGEDTKSAVDRFNNHLLTLNVISTISKVPDSQAVIDQVIKVVYNLANVFDPSQSRHVRNELVKQGGLAIVLNYLVKYSTVDKSGTIAETRPIDSASVEVRLLALRALAKIIYSVNPALAFAKHDIISSVPFLVELLGPNISHYNGNFSGEIYLDKVTSVDKYESLLALTNLTSLPNPKLRQTVIRRTFDDYICQFIVDSDNLPLQRAGWELVSNVISEPEMLAKFFNLDVSENAKRCQLAVKLLLAPDVKLQETIAGLLANATSEFEMISQVLVAHEVAATLVDEITEILSSQADDDQLVLRVAYILSNLVYAGANSGKSLGTESLVSTISNGKWKPEPMEVLSDAVSVIKKLEK